MRVNFVQTHAHHIKKSSDDWRWRKPTQTLFSFEENITHIYPAIVATALQHFRLVIKFDEATTSLHKQIQWDKCYHYRSSYSRQHLTSTVDSFITFVVREGIHRTCLEQTLHFPTWNQTRLTTARLLYSSRMLESTFILLHQHFICTKNRIIASNLTKKISWTTYVMLQFLERDFLFPCSWGAR